MHISAEGSKTQLYSTHEHVEAAPLPVQDEPGPSTRLSHHKASPILKVYNEHQLKNGADTAFAYLSVALNEQEMEELLQMNEPEFKRQLLTHMPDLLYCEPTLMEAMKDRPYSLPINRRLLRQQLNNELINHYQKQNDQKHMPIALYRLLILHLMAPERAKFLNEIKTRRLSLDELLPECFPDDFDSKPLTACLRDDSENLKLDPEEFFTQLSLMSKQKHFAPDCVEHSASKPEALKGPMAERMQELGLVDDIPTAEQLSFYNSRLATIDNAEDLVLLVSWGQKHKIPDQALCRCDEKLAGIMCSDLLIHVEQPVALAEARALLQKFMADLNQPNLPDKKKLEISTQIEQSEAIKLLRKKINETLAKDKIVATVSAFPYSGFARCYRALGKLGAKDRPEAMQGMMQSLAVYDLLEQYIRDHSPENHSQTSDEHQAEIDAQSNRSQLPTSVKINSLPKRDRTKMLDRMSDCYKNDLPMPWCKEEQTTRPDEPPAPVFEEDVVTDVRSEDEDVFS